MLIQHEGSLGFRVGGAGIELIQPVFFFCVKCGREEWDAPADGRVERNEYKKIRGLIEGRGIEIKLYEEHQRTKKKGKREAREQ